VIVLVVWDEINVSLVVIEFEINWDDDDADSGGDRNVSLCGIVDIDSDGCGTEFVIDRLSQSVRNFPWLFIVDNRLDISTPSILINSVSCRKYTLIIERDVESNSII